MSLPVPMIDSADDIAYQIESVSLPLALKKDETAYQIEPMSLPLPLGRPAPLKTPPGLQDIPRPSFIAPSAEAMCKLFGKEESLQQYSDDDTKTRACTDDIEDSVLSPESDDWDYGTNNASYHFFAGKPRTRWT